jgi:hypothetical protein
LELELEKYRGVIFLDEWNLLPEFKNETEKVGLMPFSDDDVIKFFEETIPELNQSKTPFEIDYDYSRSENKRYESLKKRGCDRIIQP